MRVGVLGGTFDPVHVGHLVLAEQAREQLGLEAVAWVPAGDPWRKADRRVSPAADRVAMLELAVAGHAAFEVSRVEVDKVGPSYTVDTLEELARQRPDSELVFVVGGDALEDLPHWHQPERLIELAVLGVAPRGGVRPGPDELDRLLPGLARRVEWIDMPRIDVSGTELRLRAARGRSLRYLVPEAVERYILEHGLYLPE